MRCRRRRGRNPRPQRSRGVEGGWYGSGVWTVRVIVRRIARCKSSWHRMQDLELHHVPWGFVDSSPFTLPDIMTR